jgi:hypothetical protein
MPRSTGARKKTAGENGGLEFAPQQVVIQSGVYQVLHHRHRFPHEATLLEGEIFPACQYCEDKVRFRLVLTAKRIELDFDFQHHPKPVLVKGEAQKPIVP